MAVVKCNPVVGKEILNRIIDSLRLQVRQGLSHATLKKEDIADLIDSLRNHQDRITDLEGQVEWANEKESRPKHWHISTPLDWAPAFVELKGEPICGSDDDNPRATLQFLQNAHEVIPRLPICWKCVLRLVGMSPPAADS